MSATARSAAALAAAIVVLVLADTLLPRVLNTYYLTILARILIAILAAVSLQLVNGFTGQFSIGHAGFMAVGAYTSAALSVYGSAPLLADLQQLFPAPVARALYFPIPLVFGGLAASLAGLLVGIPALRLRGDYLAIATLGFGEIIRIAILNIDAVGGARGFSLLGRRRRRPALREPRRDRRRRRDLGRADRAARLLGGRPRVPRRARGRDRGRGDGHRHHAREGRGVRGRELLRGRGRRAVRALRGLRPHQQLHVRALVRDHGVRRARRARLAHGRRARGGRCSPRRPRCCAASASGAWCSTRC
jgi:hypothetical protein